LIDISSDESAIGFMKVVRAAGVRGPEDVSVIGFEGIEFVDMTGRRSSPSGSRFTSWVDSQDPGNLGQQGRVKSRLPPS
jgi:hypothetical protein